jgi:lysyl-tRNA synthetase class 2
MESNSLQNIGLSAKRLAELEKDGMKEVKANLLGFLAFCKVEKTSEHIGSLLDELASGTKSPHRNIVAQYVVEGKMARPNLAAALRFLKNLGDAEFDVNKFEKECGIGITVSNEEIKQAISDICVANPKVFDEGWSAQGKMMPLIKKSEKLTFADGKVVKDMLDEVYRQKFGEHVVAAKGAKKPATTTAAKEQKEAAVDETTLDPSKYRELRIAQVENLKKQGVDPYPHKFHKTMELPAFAPKYEHLTKGEQLTTIESVCGRISLRRDSSSKLVFIDIAEIDSKLQVLANFTFYEKQDQWAIILPALRPGDLIGVNGYPSRSKTGEISIVPKEIVILAPCLHMIPTKLQEIETRFRSRHLDMLVHPKVVRNFQIRSKIISFVRNFFDKRGFLEVETPTMGVLAGGATAKPFVTHHNDLGVDLFMRVAPELYLKQLIIGGMNKVYEIGKNYRNEGIDTTHNPEFTAIESYEAYADYNDLIAMTEELLSTLVFHLYGKHQVEYHPHGVDDPECWTIDFTPPFRRYPMIATIEKKLSELEGSPVVLPTDLTSAETNKWLVAICTKHQAECSPPHTNYRLLDALCGKFIEKDLTQPGFITDHPQIMSPLAKYHRTTPGLTERFELFIAKKEIVNAYTELNEPSVQRGLFQTQALANKGDDEAQPIDEGYCTAMEYGLPPTGGWGMGIDRLCMMLTDNCNIKEVILFPAMRPLEEQMAMQRIILGKSTTFKG